MKLSNKVIMVSASALMAISPVVAGASQAVPALAAKTTSSKSKKSDVIVLAKKSYVYYSNGKRNTNYKIGKKKWPVIGKGAKLTAYGTKKINGQLYYFIGNNSYIKAVNVATLNGKKVTVKTASTANKKQTTKTIKLTSNAYVYGKNGKRIKAAGTIKKNTTITYIGTTKIKGKNYYNLGKGQYVKTANARTIKKNTSVVTPGDKDTYIKLASNSIVYDDNGEVLQPQTIFEKGAEYRALGAKKIGDKWFYKIGTIKGKSQWIKAVNAYVTSGPSLIKDSSYVEPKPSDRINADSTIVSLKPNTATYNIKGQIISNNPFAAGQKLRVSEAVWIWVPSENAAVEFYEIASDPSSYIKLSDVDMISGKSLTPTNTAEEAHDNSVVATSSDRADLTKLVEDNKNVTISAGYTLASSEAKSDYDKAISDGLRVNSDPSATIAEVKQAVNAINAALSKLNGASTSSVVASDNNNVASN